MAIRRGGPSTFGYRLPNSSVQAHATDRDGVLSKMSRRGTQLSQDGTLCKRPGRKTIQMRLLVSSAKGANGAGYGTILAFDFVGNVPGTFCDDSRVTDPRGLCVGPNGDLVYVNNGNDRVLALDPKGQVQKDTGPINELDPGGGVFGPDGRYYVGSRRLRTIVAMPARLDGPAVPYLPRDVVPFPRGFAFAPDGRIFLASGMSPSGTGENTIKVFDVDGHLLAPRLVEDPQLSPLDLAIAPNGNIVVSSEWPFGGRDAISSVREYESSSGRLVRIFRPDGAVLFRNPRGVRFSREDGDLYCVARDQVVSFDFESGDFSGAIVNCSDLFGQALEFFA
jgi:DNA-binding beta-propeller fold protein YncE